MHVLVVDDQPDIRQMFEMTLKLRRHRVTLANNGAEAVQAMQGASLGTFDVVLIDVHMPGMDGLTAARCIRALPVGQKLPIVMMTAYEHTNEQAQEAGANLMLHKPMSPMEVAKVLEGIMQ